jgi:hypothetical protein
MQTFQILVDSICDHGTQQGYSHLINARPPVIEVKLLMGEWETILPTNSAGLNLMDSIQEDLPISNNLVADAVRILFTQEAQGLGYTLATKPDPSNSMNTVATLTLAL